MVITIDLTTASLGLGTRLSPRLVYCRPRPVADYTICTRWAARVIALHQWLHLVPLLAIIVVVKKRALSTGDQTALAAVASVAVITDQRAHPRGLELDCVKGV